MPRPLRVLGLVPRRLGGSFYRVAMPLCGLAARGFETRRVIDADSTEADDAWADIVLFSHLAPREPYRARRIVEWFQARGKAVVVDFRDEVLKLDFRHEWAVRAAPFADSLKLMAGLADLVTVTGPVLQSRLEGLNERIAILPDCFDPAMWPADLTRRDPAKRLTIGVQGSDTHYEDWRILAGIFPALAGKYPDASFIVAGFCPDYLTKLSLGDRLIYPPIVPATEFPKLMSTIDIALAPLLPGYFEEAKSPIKWMEASLAGAPCVCSPTMYRNHVRHGETGFIADTVDDWIHYISLLIEDPERRRTMAAAARQEVMTTRSIHNHADHLAALYREAWHRVSNNNPSRRLP